MSSPPKAFEAILLGKRIIVVDKRQANNLYRLGYYGRFVSIKKVKRLDVEDYLELSPMEALYLMEKKLLKIVDENGDIVTTREILNIAKKEYKNFDKIYLVYKNLRDQGYVVKSGLKFGSTFAVYKYGPGIDHAPFLVHVKDYNEPLDPLEIIRAGRLSHSVKKKFVIAVVTPSNTVFYFSFEWFSS